MTPKAIELKNISLQRNESIIFENISLDINKSSIANIFGRNGCGKTSLLKIIVGLTEATSGSVTINHINANDIAYIGHKFGIKDNLTVYENLKYSNVTDNVEMETRIEDALNMYEMTHYKNILVKQLSHGQQKKVSLMKTLMNNYSIWVIDEPYSALDKKTIDIFNKTMYEFLSTDGTVIITNHSEINDSYNKVVNYKL